MKQKSYRLEDLKNVKICIGYVGENKHTQVRIDCSSAFAEYPGATPALAIRPPRGGIYPAVIDQDGDTVVWTVTNGDLLFKGDGELQFSFIRGEVIEKTFIGRFEVMRSIITTANAPEGVAEWLIRAVAAAAAAEAAARHQPMIGLDGYWYKWDSEAEEYVSTGTKAQGPQGEPGAPGDPSVLIDDASTGLDKTWSAEKLQAVKSALQEQGGDIETLENDVGLLEEGSLSALAASSGQIPVAQGDGTWVWGDDANVQKLLDDCVPGATTTVTKDSSGKITGITHKIGNVTVRTDAITYYADSIVETRTGYGKTVTITTTFSTLQTVVGVA